MRQKNETNKYIQTFLNKFIFIGNTNISILDVQT